MVSRSHPQVHPHQPPIAPLQPRTVRPSRRRRLEPSPSSAYLSLGKRWLTRFLSRLLASVAKHYLTSRASFNDTARYWAQAYAGAPTAAGGVGGATGLVPGGKKEKGDDAIALAGLDKSEVQKFENVSRSASRLRRLISCSRLSVDLSDVTDGLRQDADREWPESGPGDKRRHSLLTGPLPTPCTSSRSTLCGD